MYNYPPLRGGGDSCFRRNGTGGAGMGWRETRKFAGGIFYIFLSAYNCGAKKRERMS
ncbi:MAG: hypothetical protein ACR2QC_12460 [Gammaproteobacteria bacterium]